ncbi:MAG: diacylglycerol kinase family lipid kinase [Clostridia bacterium]|nr:diacylglycerol kinase family lipid kinase [Clostridia bacterium]
MLTFIVNPTAGNYHALRIQTLLKQELSKRGIDKCRFVRTERPGHATELARAAAMNPDCTGVVAVGGDGTAFEVACGLMDTNVPLGIIPAGTGNDFIKSVNIPKKPLEALDFILSHQARPVDVGSLNDRLFLNVCGTGFDVTVLDYTLAAKKYVRGILPYLIGLVRGIFHYAPVHVRFTVDGLTEERDVLICSVANGRFFGGGISICPDAAPNDGKLDLVVVENKPKWMIPFYLPGLLMGRVLKFRITTHKRCDTVEIVSKGMRLNVDGEILTMDRANFHVEGGKLLLFW